MVPLVHIISVTLAISAISKLRDPMPTRRALDGIGLWVGPATVRAYAVGELVVAGAAILGNRQAVIGLVMLHLGFAIFVAISMGTSGAGCGCFGVRSTAPPRTMHLVLNVASAGVALAAAIVHVGGLAAVIDSGPALVAAHLAVVAVGTSMLVALYTEGAEVADAVRMMRRQRAGRLIGEAHA